MGFSLPNYGESMRLLVFGSRTFTDRSYVYGTLDSVHNDYPVSVLIEGEAAGADTLAADWARSREIPIEAYPANWNEHGRAAGPIRNRQMLVEGQPELAVCFVDKSLESSKGSKNMYDQLMKADIQCFVYELSR